MSAFVKELGKLFVKTFATVLAVQTSHYLIKQFSKPRKTVSSRKKK